MRRSGQFVPECELALLRLKKTLLALVLAVLPSLLFAADQKFTFALPDLEGRISLGVFNERGKLVRTLYVGATTADFTIGLNGLIATWDGKSDIGVVMPSGKYFVRGFVVGDAVKAEGEAYHFNDWIEDEKSPRIVKIEDFQKVERGFVLLGQVLAGAQSQLAIMRYDREKGFLWNKILPVETTIAPSLDGTTNRLAVGASSGVAIGLGSLHSFSLETGEMIASKELKAMQVTALAAWGELADAALANNQIVEVSLASLKNMGLHGAPVSFSSLAIAANRRIGGSPSTSNIWVSDGGEWREAKIGIGAASLSFGLKETYWLAGLEEKGGAPLVGQFDMQGQLLRAYRGDFEPQQVRASTETEEISVLEKKGEVQRLRQMSLIDRSGGGTEWEINFEKTVTPCAKFGIVDGALVADAGDAPQRSSMDIALATGGLTAEAPKLTVQLASDASGLWLETASKLKLVRVADQTQANRFVLVPGENKASMTAYAGDGVVVAEYSITGLDAIAEIDAGEIEIP